MNETVNALANIRIVLVATSHPGNIGAAARAMKNMGIHQLYLVNPLFFPHADATARAAGADDVLAAAVVVKELAEAVRDCQWVIATTSRERAMSWPTLAMATAGSAIIQAAATQKVAVVFGSEQSGLSNQALGLCHACLTIPTSNDFASLNLAAAVQVVSYQIFQATLEPQSVSERPVPQLALHEEIEQFYQHLQQILVALDFVSEQTPQHIMQKLRCLFSRTQLQEKEVKIWRGILSAVQNKLINR